MPILTPSLQEKGSDYASSYRQNAAVRQDVDRSGGIVTVNSQASKKVLTQMITYDTKPVPSGPVEEEMVPLSSQDATIKSYVRRINELLDERPIWTRRSLLNKMADHPDFGNVAKVVYQYTGYMFRSGPWRDAVIKFGVDPRSDPKYRIYQTLTFQLGEIGQANKPRRKTRTGMRGGSYPSSERRPKKRGERKHIFDGNSVGTDGKTWQVCDITDPLLKALLNTDKVRTECHVRPRKKLIIYSFPIVIKYPLI